MIFNELKKYAAKPALYADSTNSLWDDEHISKGMLEAHLNPDLEAATRKHDFVDRSAAWISRIAPPAQYMKLLDLGCGPGLYAERFNKAGYSVTGIDLSKRSIEYASKQAVLNGSNIDYILKNYLTIKYTESFDIVTLIYCDYAPLSFAERKLLTDIVFKALKPGGKFILDVFTLRMRHPQSHTWRFYESGGFYSPKPNICLESFYQYDDADKTELRQIIVITEESTECYNIWNHYFDKDKLVAEIQPFGFRSVEIFSNVCGDSYSDMSETVCGVFTK